MSQQHIPQPNSQSAAPAEVFDSTADAPHGQTVSALGTPGPRPGEVIVHTGQKNSIDFSIHRQFIPIDTFIWSTSQPRGTLLWSSPVHPTRVNPLISYISEIYNTWGGGIEFNFKVAGTGFHAGALAFVRIPPNVKPTQFSSPTEWGAFEYVVMDPKTLEVLSLDVMDQRQLNFHFMKLDEDDPTSFGGYIACYVLIPLNTSSTGTQQIAVQAFSRPGSTYTMNQIIMPNIKEVQIPGPLFMEALMDPIVNIDGNDFLEPIFGVATLEANIQKFLKIFTVNLDGGAQLYRNSAVMNALRLKVTAIVNDQITCVESHNARLCAPEPTEEATLCHTVNPGWFARCSAQTYTIKRLDPLSLQIQVKFANMYGGAPVVGDSCHLIPQSKWNYTNIGFDSFLDDNYFTIPVKDEVFFMYNGAGDLTHTPQTRTFARTAQRQLMKGVITKSGALLFDVIDNATQLNLMTIKMYHEGFLTAPASMANKKITSSVHFVFNSFSSRTAPIPVTNSQLVNSLLISTSSHVASIEPVV